MRKPVVLITGANGEIGHGLIKSIAAKKNNLSIVALDIDPLDDELKPLVKDAVATNILDRNSLDRINAKYDITEIYHLAAVLSTRAEFSPHTAHDVNVGGTMNLLRIAVEQAASQGSTVKFFFPSSIAVYGLSTVEEKERVGAINEDQFCRPQTMYGCNKLYCEHLGRYYANYFRRLSAASESGKIDFRAIRFPGLISAETIPSGGTSDFGPEMIHTGGRGKPYVCFVRPDTIMPFTIMPDAIAAISQLMGSDAAQLSKSVYHICSFSVTAEDFANKVTSFYKNASVTFEVNEKRQTILDSWPAKLDDSAARKEWGWFPQFDFDSAFDDYIVPEINKRYAK